MTIQLDESIIGALEQDVKGQQNVEHRLMDKIKALETNNVKLLKEAEEGMGTFIWIGIAFCGVVFIGSGFLLYILTSKKQSNQINITANDDAPAQTSNVTTAN